MVIDVMGHTKDHAARQQAIQHHPLSHSRHPTHSHSGRRQHTARGHFSSISTSTTLLLSVVSLIRLPLSRCPLPRRCSITMRSLVLVLVLVLALCRVSSAAEIQSVSFWNDTTCTTTPINVATQYNLTESSQWPTLPSTSVYDQQGPPCANVTLGTIQSGSYECLSNFAGADGLLVMEYSAQSCAGEPAAIYCNGATRRSP